MAILPVPTTSTTNAASGKTLRTDAHKTDGNENATSKIGDAETSSHPPSPSQIARPNGNGTQQHQHPSRIPIVRQESLGAPPGHERLKRASNLLNAAGELSSKALQEALDRVQPQHPPSSPTHQSHRGRAGRRSISGLGSLVSGKDNKSKTKKNLVSSSSPSTPSPASTFTSTSTASSSLNLGASLRRTLTEVKKSGLALKRSLSATARRNFVPGGSGSGGGGNHHNNSSTNNNNIRGAETKLGRSFSEVGVKKQFSTDGKGRGEVNTNLGKSAGSQGLPLSPYPRRSATLPLSSDISEGALDTSFLLY